MECAPSAMRTYTLRRRLVECAQDELRYWRRTTDPRSGRDYWWHTASAARQWAMPTVDGKGPYEWHPNLERYA
jgi:hypothetical protein